MQAALQKQPTRYTGTAKAFHWVLALALVTLFGVGLYMTGLPFSPQRLKLYNWHKWAGVTILALSVLRVRSALAFSLQMSAPLPDSFAHSFRAAS